MKITGIVSDLKKNKKNITFKAKLKQFNLNKLGLIRINLFFKVKLTKEKKYQKNKTFLDKINQ